jgi:all-trans-8'-apo-beta-carotenal 15,15'-oxygenase
MHSTMQRRDFLHAAFRAGAAFTATAATWPAFALAPDGQAFDAAIAGQPWLKPFKGVTDDAHAGGNAAGGDLRCDALELTGRWPAALRGRFYRNGPALFERDGQRYHHWFAGDGMVQQFTIGGGDGVIGVGGNAGSRAPAVRHLGRLVRTPKLIAEQKAGRFLYAAYGTKIEPNDPNAAPAQGPDSFNTANTSVIEHAGRVLAMWEGGSAFEMRPDDLATLGPVTWQQGLAAMPFSAHPKRDAAGHLWNIGSAGANLVVWHIDAAGALVKAQLGQTPYPGGMAHDAAITAQYIVLPLPPVKLHFGEDVADGRAFTVEPNEPLRILVMRKDDIAQRRVFELPAQMVFHVGNAHERRDGSIALSFVASPTPEFVTRGASLLLAGHPAPFGGSRTQLAVLDMKTGRAHVDDLGDSVEFPRVHALREGLPTRWLLTAGNWQRRGAAPSSPLSPMFHGLQLRDVQTGRAQRYDYGAGSVVEEHIVVPKPGGRDELDAWLLGTTYDIARQRTRLNLLDARRLADGPIAQATLPYALPYGFHGNFTAAVASR